MQRHEFTTYLRAGAEQAYEDVHRAIPLALDCAMRRAGVRGWRITRQGRRLRHEVESVDRATMERALDGDPANIAWQREVAPYLAEEDPGSAADDPTRLIWDFSWPTR